MEQMRPTAPARVGHLSQPRPYKCVRPPLPATAVPIAATLANQSDLCEGAKPRPVHVPHPGAEVAYEYRQQSFVSN
jgi:hypothetical protein